MRKLAFQTAAVLALVSSAQLHAAQVQQAQSCMTRPELRGLVAYFLPTVLQSVAPGAAGSWSLSNLGPRIIAGNFDPGFFVEHFIKDMGIVLSEAQRMNLALPGIALARQLYIALQAQGHGRSGTHALLLALASLSGVEWKTK